MKYALIAAVAAILGGAAVAGAANDFTLGSGDLVSLAGTSVHCDVSSGEYGGVMLCERAGSSVGVWISQKELFVSKGSNPKTMQLLATFSNWQGG